MLELQKKEFELNALRSDLNKMDELQKEGKEMQKQKQHEREQLIRLNAQNEADEKTIKNQLIEINKVQEKYDQTMIQLLKHQEKVEDKDTRIKKLEEIEVKYKLENENYGKKIEEMSALLDRYKVQYEQQLQAQQIGHQE